MKMPICPKSLPDDMSSKLAKLGHMWAKSELRPRISAEVEKSWSKLLHDWAAKHDFPLLIRKGSLVRGSKVMHNEAKRIIVPCDNSPAQWACNLAVQGIVPSLDDIKTSFKNDTIPVSFANKAKEKEQRAYHCTLGGHSVNRAGWKLCHIKPVGLNSRTPLNDIEISELKRVFIELLSPVNYFLMPIQWGGLGETQEFIEGYISEIKHRSI